MTTAESDKPMTTTPVPILEDFYYDPCECGSSTCDECNEEWEDEGDVEDMDYSYMDPGEP